MEAVFAKMFQGEEEEENDPERQKLVQEHLDKFKNNEFWASKLNDVKDNPFPEPIRVNLPGSEESFRTGNGEGCWATVSVSTKQIDDQGKWGGAFVALLENTPIYPQWRHLEYGSPVIFQFRGPNKRAVAYPDQDKALKEAQLYETSGIGKNDPECPYVLIDYVLPSCDAALAESRHYPQFEKHPLWDKIRACQAHHNAAASANQPVSTPERHHAHDDNPDENRSNKPPHTFASKAIQAWKAIQHDNLIQFIKFVAATLSDAPKFDFLPLLELLTLLKSRLAIGESIFHVRDVRMIVSEPGVAIWSLFLTHAPQHFKPEQRLTPQGTMIESQYSQGLALIWAYEFLDAKIENLIRQTSGPLFAQSAFGAHPLLTSDADDSKLLSRLAKMLERTMEDHKDELYSIIHKVIQCRLDTLETMCQYAGKSTHDF
eukprot:TRINITY_DN456_c0_g1_i1.p1 TRINITY_DN456_c0_g1~~TRINITY_DN456_c0_g1_i1.p1  ORF type:complete len:430 (-),score=65.06 TRINITY_DN456_c0_g1_i1:1271-2560(-)